MSIELISEIKRGRQRKIVLKHVKEEPLIVSEIMHLVNEDIKKHSLGKEIRLRDVSRSLKWLASKGLVKCLNPSNEHGVKGILYKLTKKGKEII